MQTSVKFKHTSVKDCCNNRRHTHNKVKINLQDGSVQEYIEQLADFTVMDIIVGTLYEVIDELERREDESSSSI